MPPLRHFSPLSLGYRTCKSPREVVCHIISEEWCHSLVPQAVSNLRSPDANANMRRPRPLGHSDLTSILAYSRYTVSAHIEARASIFRSGFLGGPLIKFIIPGLLIELGFYWFELISMLCYLWTIYQSTFNFRQQWVTQAHIYAMLHMNNLAKYIQF